MTSTSAGPGGPWEDPAVWGPRLERLLAEQRQAAGELRELARRQRGLIDQNQTDGLLALLAERQVVVDRLADLSRQAEPFGRGWAAYASQLPSERRARVERLAEEVAELIGLVAKSDQTDRVLLEERRSGLAAELSAVGRGRGALAAYEARSRDQAPRDLA
ncbi:MAG TPA: hypothetical protein VD963_07315 [Phycisphaerales bacterium]|nr:hypothetical protein [Phycisphaerales bacterium]